MSAEHDISDPDQEQQITEASGANSEQGDQDLAEQLAVLEAKANENWDKFVRSQAELDNLKKRSQRDLENAHKFGLEKFANELLAVRDSMEMGLGAAKADDAKIDTIIEGSEMTFAMFNQVMTKFDIQIIDPINEKFDPDLHQAMSMQPTGDVEPNTVINVMQKGYTLSGRLLRPALVVVASAAT